jgi:hypothetical protein
MALPASLFIAAATVEQSLFEAPEKIFSTSLPPTVLHCNGDASEIVPSHVRTNSFKRSS